MQKPGHVTTSSEGSCSGEEEAGLRSQQRKWSVLMSRLERVEGCAEPISQERPLKTYCELTELTTHRLTQKLREPDMNQAADPSLKTCLKPQCLCLRFLALPCSCFQTLNLCLGSCPKLQVPWLNYLKSGKSRGSCIGEEFSLLAENVT